MCFLSRRALNLYDVRGKRVATRLDHSVDCWIYFKDRKSDIVVLISSPATSYQTGHRYIDRPYFNFRLFAIHWHLSLRRAQSIAVNATIRVGKHCPAKLRTFLRTRNKSDRYEYARVLSFTRSRPRAHSETGSQLIYIWLYPVRHPILVAPLINGLNIRPAAI